MPAEDFTVVKAVLVSSAAPKLMNFDVVPMGSYRMKQLTLFYSFADAKLGLAAARYLALCASTLNGNTPRQWVVDPLGSIEEYKGTYRQVSLRYDKHGKEPGIIQVLREGFLQALPPSEDQEDEARLVSCDFSTRTGMRTLRRRWVNIDPEYLQAVQAAKAVIGTVTNPVCEVLDYETDPLMGQKTYTGLFTVADRVSIPQQDDITGSMEETLQEVTAVSTLAGLTALTPAIITQTNEIRELFTTATGDADSIALKYDDLAMSSRAYCMGEAAANLQGLVVSGDFPAWVGTTGVYVVGNRVIQSNVRYLCLVAHTANASFATDLAAGKWLPLIAWTYADRKFTEEQDTTGTFTLLLRRERWNTGTEATDALVIEQQALLGRADPSLTRVWLRRTYEAYQTLVGIATAWTTGVAYAKDALVTNTGNYICLVAHTAGVFATDLAAGKWLKVGTVGQALAAVTYQSTTYYHLSWSAVEGQDGSYTVHQYLNIPGNSISIHDLVGEHLVAEWEEWLSLDGDTMIRCICKEYAKIVSSPTDAVIYALTSKPYWVVGDRNVEGPLSKGFVKYNGNYRYEAQAVGIIDGTGA